MTTGMASMAISLLLLAGCGVRDAAPGNGPRDVTAVASPTTAQSPPSPRATPDRPVAGSVTDGWLGRWVGVEGLVLTISRADRPATYRLHIVLLDGAADYAGIADGDTIRFRRDGATQAIRHATGDETGLKWLADKRDCLVIRPGEGFCRD